VAHFRRNLDAARARIDAAAKRAGRDATEIRLLHDTLHPIETLFVVDAMQGQDAVNTAKAFNDTLPLTGVVLTKLDGTAKGGIVVTVQKELGVPVKLVGLGEGADDLAPFDPEGFVDALLG